MAKKIVVTRGAITISDGVVRKDGKKVGTLLYAYKFGYHPVAELKINGEHIDYFELDEKNKIDRALELAEKHAK